MASALGRKSAMQQSAVTFRLKAEAERPEAEATRGRKAEATAAGSCRGSRYNDRSPVMNPHAPGRPPTLALLLGLLITLATVVAYSWYISGQISGLAAAADRAHRSQPQGLAAAAAHSERSEPARRWRCATCWMRATRYPLTAWSAQFDRIRLDLDDALAQEEDVAHRPTDARAGAVPGELGGAVLGRRGPHVRAGARRAARTRRARRSGCRCRRGRRRSSTPWRGCSSRTTRARSRRRSRSRTIYAVVQRQVYWFLAATLGRHRADQPVSDSIEPAAVRAARRRCRTSGASWRRQLIATRESTLREISRELHDEFGQVLTAMGSMLGRADAAGAGRARRCAPTCARSARSRRRRSTTCAACRRRCTRRSSRSWGSRARSTGTCPRSSGSSASRWTTSATAQRGRIDDTDRHPRLPRAAGGDQQRRAAFRRQERPGAPSAAGRCARARGRGPREGPRVRAARGAGSAWWRCASAPSCSAARSSCSSRATAAPLVRLTRADRPRHRTVTV